ARSEASGDSVFSQKVRLPRPLPLTIVPCERPASRTPGSRAILRNRALSRVLRSGAMTAQDIGERKSNGSSSLFDGGGAFGFDPTVAVERLSAADPTLMRLIESIGPFRMQIRQTRDVF